MENSQEHMRILEAACPKCKTKEELCEKKTEPTKEEKEEEIKKAVHEALQKYEQDPI